MKVNGVELEYAVTGTGEPVLLISTGPIADSFLPFVSEPALAERYRLITYRQRRRGYGTQSPVTFAEHAADAASLLRGVGVSRAHIAGHSTGAAIALQLAVEQPELVHTLALLEPTLLSAPSVGAFLEKAAPALATHGAGDGDEAMAQFLSVVCSLDWETCRKLIEEHVPGGVARAMRDADNWFCGYLPALKAWQFGPDQAAKIAQPVLSVLGTDTEQWFVDCDALLHSWFPRVEDCSVDGVAHLLHMQRPEPVARGVAAFFARHPLAAAAPPVSVRAPVNVTPSGE